MNLPAELCMPARPLNSEYFRYASPNDRVGWDVHQTNSNCDIEHSKSTPKIRTVVLAFLAFSGL